MISGGAVMPGEPVFYPQNECQKCNEGDPVIKGHPSSIVGMPYYHRGGMLCMKYLKPEYIAALKKAKEARDAR